MKLIVKERKSLRESDASEPSISWKVKTDPRNFLALAKEDNSGNVQSRAAAYGKFDPERASGMYLGIDPTTGKVTEHGGRARSQTAINSGVKEIEIQIKIDTSRTDKQFTWDTLPKYFLPEDGREGHVAKSDFKLKEESDKYSFDDILRTGGKEKVFQREVVQNPNGPYVRQDPNREVPTWVSVRYTENFTPALRKSAGIPPNKAGELPVPVLEALKQYRELVNKQYKFVDEKGELKIVQNNPPYGSTLKLDREAVGNVTMSLR